MKDSESAFPYKCNYGVYVGLSKRQYAAIKLKVPRSGDPDIDAMIRESRRDEFAKAAMAGIMSIPSKEDLITGDTIVADTQFCLAYADAMLAELGEEAGK
jgi:hypothetical protein